ncbi:MAG: efflux RND transporter periplasmic adaptor subunit [Bdellovibrionales bacterium]|nr:efflux RND transporter periplasmic adaptor subunit [Bdellovibrionales bacterium]
MLKCTLKSLFVIGISLGFISLGLQLTLAQSPPVSVIVSKTENGEWYDAIEALGTLRANETVVLTASVTDTITNIHFDDGQRVEKGFVLAEMTDEEESALVQEMSARVEEAKRQLDRIKELPQKGAVSESLIDQRKREYQAAIAQLEAMKSRLKDRLIVAPFSGVLGLRNISAGALVEPGDEIVTLTDDSVLKLDFSVPSVFLSSLEVGLPIVTTSAAYPEKTFEGVVKSIDSRIDPNTRAITIRAVIPNEEHLLRPGLLMNVSLRYRFRQALSVPEEAIISRGAQTEVFVVAPASTTAEQRSVRLGRRAFGKVEVTEGLKEGELVVSHGTMKVRPGQPVQILAEQRSGESIQDILTGNRPGLKKSETPQEVL